MSTKLSPYSENPGAVARWHSQRRPALDTVRAAMLDTLPPGTEVDLIPHHCTSDKADQLAILIHHQDFDAEGYLMLQQTQAGIPANTLCIQRVDANTQYQGYGSYAARAMFIAAKAAGAATVRIGTNGVGRWFWARAHGTLTGNTAKWVRHTLATMDEILDARDHGELAALLNAESPDLALIASRPYGPAVFRQCDQYRAIWSVGGLAFNKAIDYFTARTLKPKAPGRAAVSERTAKPTAA